MAGSGCHLSCTQERDRGKRIAFVSQYWVTKEMIRSTSLRTREFGGMRPVCPCTRGTRPSDRYLALSALSRLSPMLCRKRKVVLQMRCPWWWKRVMVFCRSAGVCRLVELVMGSESVNAPRLYSDDPSCSSLLGDQSYRCVEGDLPLGKPGDIFNDRSICHREERFALGRCPTLSGDI